MSRIVPSRALGHPALGVVLALSALAGGLTACGAAPSTPRAAPLGVQSNGGASTVTLRMSAARPMTFATELHVSLESQLMGQPLSAELETRGVRRVLEQRPDGSIAMEELDTSSRYAVTMMGHTETSPETTGAPGAPQRYLLRDRGRRIEEITTTSGVSAPSAGAEDAIQRRLAGALDPLVHALEYPERPVSPGEHWGSDGLIALAEIDPAMSGGATYRMTQRLERFEGSGEARVAVISIDGSFDGTGATDGARGGPTDGGIAGSVHFQGFYTVTLTDGFTRAARVRFDGEARLGPDGVMRFPVRGEIRWDAAPIAVR